MNIWKILWNILCLFLIGFSIYIVASYLIGSVINKEKQLTEWELQNKVRGEAVARILQTHRNIDVDPADAWVITVGFSDFDIVFGEGVDILASNIK